MHKASHGTSDASVVLDGHARVVARPHILCTGARAREVHREQTQKRMFGEDWERSGKVQSVTGLSSHSWDGANSAI